MFQLPPDYRILVIEDDLVSVLMMKRAMRKLKIKNPLTVCRDGLEALEYLRKAAPSGARVGPHIVTLDLNMPRMDGVEFLGAIRDVPELSDLKVLMCTGGEVPKAVIDAESPHLAGFLLKDRLLESLGLALADLQGHPASRNADFAFDARIKKSA